MLASSVGFGTVWSYVRTAHQEVGRKLRDTVPIAFELQRLEQMTSDLIPEMRANQKVAAQMDVEIEYLKREIDSLDASQSQAKAEMEKLRKALVEQHASCEFGGRLFSRRDVEKDLDSRLNQYDAVAVQTDAKRRILQDRQRTLDAASEKIREYRRQYEGLVQKAESLKAELKLVELTQETGNFDFNHSKLQEVKELSREVEKKIETVKRYVEGQREVGGEIPVEADAKPIAERFDEYFADGRPQP
jgi:myosin heavy subunit